MLATKIALMGCAAIAVSSALSMPCNRNNRIRSCVKAPIKNHLTVQDMGIKISLNFSIA